MVFLDETVRNIILKTLYNITKIEIIFDKKKTFIRKSLNYLLFIIMIAKCQTPGLTVGTYFPDDCHISL